MEQKLGLSLSTSILCMQKLEVLVGSITSTVLGIFTVTTLVNINVPSNSETRIPSIYSGIMTFSCSPSYDSNFMVPSSFTL